MLSHQTLVRPATPASNGPAQALSLQQPWAWVILFAGKRIENRTWATSYRGRIYLHAGMRIDWDGLSDLEEEIRAVPEPRPPAYRAALVGVADLVDCVRPEDVEHTQRDWAIGPWCFVLENVRPLSEPIPYRGSLGIFRVDAVQSKL